MHLPHIGSEIKDMVPFVVDNTSLKGNNPSKFYENVEVLPFELIVQRVR